MPSYRYKAIDEAGKSVRGRLEADNPTDLEGRLERLALELVTFSEEKATPLRRTYKVGRREMIAFCVQMEQIMKAGVPILEGLSDLRESNDNPSLRALIANLLEEIGAGRTLAESMERFPQVFDSVFVTLVRAGERSGRLPEIFARLGEDYKWSDEMTERTKKLLIYPSIMAVVMGGVFIFMMTYLVPQLVTFMTMMNMELPFYSRMLIATSNFVRGYLIPILVTPVALVALITMGRLLSPGLAYFFDAVKLRLWLYGPLMQKLLLARFAGVFATMYGAGITVVDCMDTGRTVMNNRVFQRVMIQVNDQVRGGSGLAVSFQQMAIFPPLVVRMIAVGERTGSLETSLRNVQYFYDREVREGVDKLQSMLEPMITLFLGGLMAWVVISVLGPIYDIMQNMKM